MASRRRSPSSEIFPPVIRMQKDLAAPRPMRPRKLVQLRKAEALRMLDHHDGGVGHVDADFDHRGRDQNVQLAFLEAAHDVFFLVSAQAAVQKPDPQVGKIFLLELLVHLDRGFQLALFVLLDHRIDDVRLMSGGDLLAHELPDFVGAIVGDAAGDDGRAAGGISSSTLMSRSP